MKRNWKLILVEAESTHPSDDYYEPQVDATPITSTDDFTQKVLKTILDDNPAYLEELIGTLLGGKHREHFINLINIIKQPELKKLDKFIITGEFGNITETSLESDYHATLLANGRGLWQHVDVDDLKDKYPEFYRIYKKELKKKKDAEAVKLRKKNESKERRKEKEIERAKRLLRAAGTKV